MTTKRYVESEQRYLVRLPYSEVAMHMGVAGRVMLVELTEDARGAQLYTVADERPFSFPILPGEAGFFLDSTGFYYLED